MTLGPIRQCFQGFRIFWWRGQGVSLRHCVGSEYLEPMPEAELRRAVGDGESQLQTSFGMHAHMSKKRCCGMISWQL